MNEYSHPDFEELVKNQGNYTCFDCGKDPATWASVNNSIYLCLDCAGVHRGFGVETSFIRSITMDKWKARHVQLMKNGGNTRLKKLLKEFGVDHNYPREELYYTKLLDYYRTCLRNEVTCETPPTKIDNDQALQSLKKVVIQTPVNRFDSVSSNTTNDTTTKSQKNSFLLPKILIPIVLVSTIVIFGWLNRK